MPAHAGHANTAPLFGSSHEPPTLPARNAATVPIRSSSGAHKSSGRDSISSAFQVAHSNPFAAWRIQAQSGSQPPPAVPAPEGGSSPLEGDSSPLAAGINLVKCAVGAGSFSLPVAFKLAGFWPALVLTLSLGALATATAEWLTAAERKKSRELGVRLTYPDLLRACFPGRTGAALAILSLGGIIFTSMGVCVAYVDFIVGALVDIIPNASQGAVMALLYPIVALLALLRSFRYLAFTSILGDVAVAAGLIGTIVIGISSGQRLEPPPTDINFAELPRAAGNIAFLFLIHVVILPIAQVCAVAAAPSSNIHRSSRTTHLSPRTAHHLRAVNARATPV